MTQIYWIKFLYYIERFLNWTEAARAKKIVNLLQFCQNTQKQL